MEMVAPRRIYGVFSLLPQRSVCGVIGGGLNSPPVEPWLTVSGDPWRSSRKFDTQPNQQEPTSIVSGVEAILTLPSGKGIKTTRESIEEIDAEM